MDHLPRPSDEEGAQTPHLDPFHGVVSPGVASRYHSGIDDDILSIRTFYEQQWLDRGMTIKYIQFVCEPRDAYVEPDVEIEYDSYRSFNRSKRSAAASGK